MVSLVARLLLASLLLLLPGAASAQLLTGALAGGGATLSNPVTPAQGGTGGNFSASTGLLYDAAGTFSAIPCASGLLVGGAPPTCPTTISLTGLTFSNQATWSATQPMSISGNAATASALAADPADCAVGTVALGINAAGTAQCTTAPTLGGLTVTGASATVIAETITNTTSGAAARAERGLTAGTTAAVLYALSQGYTTAGQYVAASVLLENAGVGGIGYSANNASGTHRFYVNGVEAARIGAGLMVGTTTDPGAGILNALTGFRIGNAAASGNVLRGNGTNFVSSTLASTDLSDVATLVTLTGSQALTNKTYNGLTLTSTTGTFTLAAGKTVTQNSTLTYSGTDGSSVAFGAGGTVLYTGGSFVKVVKVQKFTASGTYTPSTGIQYAIIECPGAGGAGGGVAGAVAKTVAGGGGGAGSYSRAYVTAAQIGASQTVTIGAGGTVGTTGNNAGNAGGDTSVGTLCVGKGGSGGGGADGSTFVGAAGAGGIAGTGDAAAAGAPGGVGVGGSIITVAAVSGVGGSGHFGGGGAARLSIAADVVGQAGSVYGSGGSGGVAYNTANTQTGGAGSAGLVIVTEFTNQ